MSRNRNPRRNASGCVDLTAFYAIRAADREIKKKCTARSGQKAHKPQAVCKGGRA